MGDRPALMRPRRRRETIQGRHLWRDVTQLNKPREFVVQRAGEQYRSSTSIVTTIAVKPKTALLSPLSLRSRLKRAARLMENEIPGESR